MNPTSDQELQTAIDQVEYFSPEAKAKRAALKPQVDAEQAMNELDAAMAEFAPKEVV